MRVMRYVSERTVEVFRLSTDSRHDFAREPSGDCQTPITIIIPDPPIEVMVYKNTQEECECLIDSMNPCLKQEQCIKYTGTLNPVTP